MSDELLKILNDETLTSEKKAEAINKLNVENTNKAVEKRLNREKEKQAKEKAKNDQEGDKKDIANAELLKRIEFLENSAKVEKEKRFKDKYGEKDWEQALEKSNKGYDENDLEQLYKIKKPTITDFQTNPKNNKSGDGTETEETKKAKQEQKDKEADELLKELEKKYDWN